MVHINNHVTHRYTWYTSTHMLHIDTHVWTLHISMYIWMPSELDLHKCRSKRTMHCKSWPQCIIGGISYTCTCQNVHSDADYRKLQLLHKHVNATRKQVSARCYAHAQECALRAGMPCLCALRAGMPCLCAYAMLCAVDLLSLHGSTGVTSATSNIKDLK